MTPASGHLNDLCSQLQEGAARLRDGDLSPAEAAELVDDCARLAADAAAELERQVRAEGQAPPARQGELL